MHMTTSLIVCSGLNASLKQRLQCASPFLYEERRWSLSVSFSTRVDAPLQHSARHRGMDKCKQRCTNTIYGIKHRRSSIRCILPREFDTLPDEICNNKRLKRLKTYGLHTLHGISRVPQLEEFDVCNGSLVVFPECIEDLRHLRRLVVRETKTVSLPASIGRLQHLKQLYAPNNQLSLCLRK